MRIQSVEALKDLAIVIISVIFVLVLSYFLNLFGFLVELFEKDPKLVKNIDEVIVVLLTLSMGFAVFSWRRWNELKKEADRRLQLQEELLSNAETKAETERIICKQLRREIEERKRIFMRYEEKETILTRRKA